MLCVHTYWCAIRCFPRTASHLKGMPCVFATPCQCCIHAIPDLRPFMACVGAHPVLPAAQPGTQNAGERRKCRHNYFGGKGRGCHPNTFSGMVCIQGRCWRWACCILPHLWPSARNDDNNFSWRESHVGCQGTMSTCPVSPALAYISRCPNEVILHGILLLLLLLRLLLLRLLYR